MSMERNKGCWVGRGLCNFKYNYEARSHTQVVFVQIPEKGKERTSMNILGESIQPEESIRLEVMRWKHD